MTVNGHEASFGGKENIIKLDSGDGSALATGSLRRIQAGRNEDGPPTHTSSLRMN